MIRSPTANKMFLLIMIFNVCLIKDKKDAFLSAASVAVGKDEHSKLNDHMIKLCYLAGNNLLPHEVQAFGHKKKKL